MSDKEKSIERAKLCGKKVAGVLGLGCLIYKTFGREENVPCFVFIDKTLQKPWITKTKAQAFFCNEDMVGFAVHENDKPVNDIRGSLQAQPLEGKAIPMPNPKKYRPTHRASCGADLAVWPHPA